MKKIILFLILALTVSIISPLQQPAAVAAPPAQEPQPAALTPSCYLPFVGRCAPQTAESPFSLQIATDNLILSPADADLSPEELQARIEAAEAKIDQVYLYLADALAESGAGYSRLFLKWSVIQPTAPVAGQPPVYRWTYYDTRFAAVAQKGVKIIVTIASTPSWAAPFTCRPPDPDKLDDYRDFVTALVNRYKQAPYGVKHYEIVNEPDYTYDSNMGWGCMGERPEQYAQMLSTAYQAIKAADPGATVLMGGIAYDGFQEYGGPFPRYFPDRVMENGGGNSIDALNLHYFPDYHKEWERWDPTSEDRIFGWIPAPTCGDVYDNQGPTYDAYGIDVIAKVTHFQNRMRVCHGVNKPVWITELAEHGETGNPASLDKQAKYVVQGHVRALAIGVKNITWYALYTIDGYDQGLLDENLNPKPAYTSYQTLTSELKDYRYVETRSLTNGELYVFRNSCGQEKMVAWSTSSSSLRITASSVRTKNYLGVETLIQDGGAGDADGSLNHTISINVTGPVFVEIATP